MNFPAGERVERWMYGLAWKGVLIPLKKRTFKTVHKMRLCRNRWFDFGHIFKRDNNKSYKKETIFSTNKIFW